MTKGKAWLWPGFFRCKGRDWDMWWRLNGVCGSIVSRHIGCPFPFVMPVLWLCRRMSSSVGNTHKWVAGPWVSELWVSGGSGRKKVLATFVVGVRLFPKQSSCYLDIKWVPQGYSESLVVQIYCNRSWKFPCWAGVLSQEALRRNVLCCQDWSGILCPRF